MFGLIGLTVPILLLSLVIFYGLTLFSLFPKLQSLPKSIHLPIVLLISTLLGWICFWIVYLSKFHPTNLSIFLVNYFVYILIFLGILILFIPKWRKNLWSTLSSKDFYFPLIMIFSLSVNSITFLATRDRIQKNLADPIGLKVFGESGSEDYLIMYELYKELTNPGRPYWSKEPPQNYYMSTHRERIPLQSGLFVLVNELHRVLTRLNVPHNQFFYLFSLMCQHFALAALFAVFRLRHSLFESLLGSTLIFFTPFGFYWSLFAVPKLWAGGFLLMGALLLILLPLKNKRAPTGTEIILGSVFCATAVLAHQASLLGLPFLAFFLMYKYPRNIITYLLATGVFAILVYPYLYLFQIYEPWGSGSSRFFLTNISDRVVYEDLNIPLGKAIIQSYQKTDIASLLASKLNGLKNTFLMLFQKTDDFHRNILNTNFYSWFLSWNFLLIGFWKFWKKMDRPQIALLLWTGSTALLISLCSFQGSLHTTVFPFGVLCGFYSVLFTLVLQMKRPWPLVILSGQSLYFLIVYIFIYPDKAVELNMQNILWYGLSYIPIAAILFATYRSDKSKDLFSTNQFQVN